MKKMNLFLLVNIFVIQLYAQTSVQRINIKGGNTAWENFMKEVYLFPAFEAGIVEYRGGKQFKGNLNYNKVIGTIEFIDEKSDTLALTNEESIKSVSIGAATFVYMPDCMQIVADRGKVRLMKNERVRIADKQKIGGYGIANSTGTIESIDRLDTRISYNEIDINENLLLNKTSTFFLETEQHELIPASKKSVVEMFHKHESSIRQFIKEKQIEFNKEEDLVELTGYLSQL